jgi:hypothetical protein
MAVLQSGIIAFFTLLLAPVARLAPIWPLLALSLALTIVFLLVFRKTTNSVQVSRVKNLVQAHILELRLFKDSPRILLSALGKIVFHNVRYLALSLKPLLVMTVPIVLLLVHFESWFGYRPLHRGEATIVTVQTENATAPGLSIQSPPDIVVETASLWDQNLREMSWRIRPKAIGHHRLVIQGPNGSVEKTITVADEGWPRVWPVTVKDGFWNQLWNPGEAILPAENPVKQVRVDYPVRSIRLWRWEMNWLLIFFLTSCLFGWIVSRRMKLVI